MSCRAGHVQAQTRVKAMDSKEVIRILAGAKDTLINGGWYQGAFGDGEFSKPNECTCYCIMGAIDSTAEQYFGWSLRNEEGKLFRLAIETVLQERGEHEDMQWPATWNDASGRTKEEVLSLLDDTIMLVQRNTQTKELHEFYKAYYAWATDRSLHVFNNDTGLCSNLLNFLNSRLVPDEKHIEFTKELRQQFKDCGLGWLHPFDKSFNTYTAEEDKTQNAARMSWVRKHIREA